MDFVPPDLEFVPPGLDFLPKNLVFLHPAGGAGLPVLAHWATVADREAVDPWEPCSLLDAAGRRSIHPERGKIEIEDRLLLDPFVAVLLSDR